MEAIKRKRVTQVGSGAWSIYLPKKWIDLWTPAQQRQREVDLHLISGALLIVPVLQDRSFAATVSADDDLSTLLRSAYVRGYEEVELRPADRFRNEDIANARDLLRHLDERIVASVGSDRISFLLPATTNAPADLLDALGVRLRETVDLATECIEQAGLDPERVVHAARLLHAIQDEDVSRLLHQTLRRVATLDLPITSVTDFQLLDLATFLLHSIGVQCQELARLVLADLGLRANDLALSREDLLRRLQPRDPPRPVARDILHGHRSMLRAARDLLQRLLDALRGEDLAELDAVKTGAHEVRDELHARLFDVVVRHWGDETSKQAAAEGFAAYRLVTPLTNIASAMWACADQALLFLSAKPKVPT